MKHKMNIFERNSHVTTRCNSKLQREVTGLVQPKRAFYVQNIILGVI